MGETFEERLATAERIAEEKKDRWRDAVETRKAAQARETDAERDWQTARQDVTTLMREELASRNQGNPNVR